MPDVTLLDLIELEFGYTTIVDHYYEPLATQRLLDGARSGIGGYLRAIGIRGAYVAPMHAQANGRGAVPAIERDVGLVIERYGGRIGVRHLVYATIRGELAVLHDPYSVLFTSGQLAQFTDAIAGSSFGGVGIVLARDDATGIWRVDQVLDGGPAARAGVRAGDAITAVDGHAVTGLAGEQMTTLLRGPTGSIVRLAVTRGGSQLCEPFVLTRAVVTPPTVTARMLPGEVAYAALRSFDLTAPTELRAAFERLDAAGARARILDLRGNGGGYAEAAIRVASLFVDGGPIVTTEQLGGKRETADAQGPALPPKPLIVLVDGDSASASELVAGAIRDRGAGRLVGTKTFGKGVVQTMFPLPDGAAIKLTTARYLTPAGKSIDRVGLLPDVVVARPPDAVVGQPGSDPQLDAALRLLVPSGGEQATASPDAE